jgi:FAD:protein FMN transferase
MKNSVTTCTRRSFLRRSAMLGLGFCAFGVAPLAAQAARFGSHGHALSTTRVMLGTIVHITAVHPSRTLAEEAVGRAYQEMHRLAAIFDRYKADTALGVLNDQGRLLDAPAELMDVMDRALGIHSMSDGAFDVTVAPVVDLFKAKSSNGAPLEISDSELAGVMDLVNAKRIILAEGGVRFGHQGMRVSLDGIAKGYIVDRASAVLSAHGIENHLINAGGDIRTRGINTGGGPWRIAVEDPSGRGAYPDVFSMRDGAVATSGGYEIFFDREKLYHHIVSPVTGRSPDSAVSVSVRADSVVEADALSTALFVMPPGQGLALINALPGRECLIVNRKGAHQASRRWGHTDRS